MGDELRFEADTHTYWIGGTKVPSVTQNLRAAAHALGGDVGLYYPEEAAERGTDVHLAAQDYDLGQPAEIHATRAGYMDAYLAFTRHHEPDWGAIEHAMGSLRQRCAGTLDRAGRLRGVPDVILDLKTGVRASWHGIQLAAYATLYRPDAPHTLRRFTLYLSAEGEYELYPWLARDDFSAWHAALVLAAHWRISRAKGF